MQNLILTAGAQRALDRSVQFAQSRAAPCHDTVHLLSALLQEESVAWEVLDQAGVTHQTICQQGLLPESESADEDAAVSALTEAVQGALVDSVAEHGPPHSAELDATLDFARRMASLDGPSEEISSGHLLAGLAAVDSPVADLLRRHGVTTETLAQAELPGGFRDVPVRPIAVEFQLEFEAGSDGQIPVLRILDAAANRAREGLRVVEDFVRLTLDDSHLSRRVKELRHQLSSLMAGLSDMRLIQSRDTRGDVGTAISTPQEMSRSSLEDVLKAGLKRAQEAARTLEEFSKVISRGSDLDCATVPGQFAQIRYGLYTLEKAILTAVGMHSRLSGRSLNLLLTVDLCHLDWETVLRESIAGGIDIVQVREKSMTANRLISHLRQVRKITRETGTTLIVNDRPDLAVLGDCDGVHIGQEDLSVRDVRKVVGPDRLIGVSTHSIEQARRAVLDGAGYLGIGPVFRSQTKNFEEFAGLDFVTEVSAEISLPAFAIGGIADSNLTDVVQAGARRVAVSGAVCGAEDPRAAAAALARGLVNQ